MADEWTSLHLITAMFMSQMIKVMREVQIKLYNNSDIFRAKPLLAPMEEDNLADTKGTSVLGG